MKRMAPFFVWMGLLSVILLGGCFEDPAIPGLDEDVLPEDIGEEPGEEAGEDPGEETGEDDPDHFKLCWPCEGDDDCLVDGEDIGSRCMPTPLTEEGMQFCGAQCATQDDCPQTHECVPSADADEGEPSGQCVRVEGVCLCTAEAVEAQAATLCWKEGAASSLGAQDGEVPVCEGVAVCVEVDVSPGPCETVDPPEDVCNQIDDDCDGEIDEDFVEAGLGDPCDSEEDADACPNGTWSCTPDGLGVVCTGDVATPEICSNEADDDCDGVLDQDEEDAEGCVVYVMDADSDGYGTLAETPDSSKCLCAWKAPYTALLDMATDCDDDNDLIHPGMEEDCATAIDDNCDAVANDVNALGCTLFHPDVDGDGQGAASPSQCLCNANDAFTVTNADDCCDTDSNAKKGQTGYFCLPRQGCGGYDYDCANGEEKQYPIVAKCKEVTKGDFTTCEEDDGWESAVPLCGQTATFDTLKCGYVSIGNCALESKSSSPVQQCCR